MIGRNTPLPNIPDAVTLQWANGKAQARRAGADRFAPHVGFHLEVGRDEELDRALHGAGFELIEIKHQRPGGAEVVRHWDVGEAAHILPITAGPVAATVAGCLANGNARATADAGIGLRWGQGERSRMAVRALVGELWAAGYRRPVQLAVRSRMTDKLLAALLDHVRVAEAADQLVDRARHPAPVSPAELWLPLRAGAEVEFGRGDTATVVPLESGHPSEVDRAYIRSIWRAEEAWASAVAAWPAVQAWALDYGAGRDDDAPGPEQEADEAPAAVRRQVRY